MLKRARGPVRGRRWLARSLTGRLLVLWSLSLAAALVAVLLLAGFARQSLLARSERAVAVARTGCGLVREQFAFYAADVKAETGLPPRADLAAVVALALRDLPATAGGIWQDGTPLVMTRGDRGIIALPAPDVLAAMVAQALRDDRGAQASSGGIAVSACLLPGPWSDLVAWVATPAGAAPALPGGARLWNGWGGLGVGLGLLLVLIAGIALWSSRLLLAWRRALGELERAVRQTGAAPGGAVGGSALQPAGEPGLDRVVRALNDSRRQLAAAQERAAAAARLAALGKVAAGIAHEVRNPIAAIRLRAENAIAGNDARRAAALPAILEQTARLDRLTASLLDMTRPRSAAPVACDLRALCTEIATSRLVESGRAEMLDPGLCMQVQKVEAMLDAALLRAGLGNLVLNAAQHARSRVVVEGVHADGVVRLTVGDDGPGVDPALRATLFDPFVTGRADGTGLGLAIAREAIAAHGGTVVLDADHASRFIIEIPQ